MHQVHLWGDCMHKVIQSCWNIYMQPEILRCVLITVGTKPHG